MTWTYKVKPIAMQKQMIMGLCLSTRRNFVMFKKDRSYVFVDKDLRNARAFKDESLQRYAKDVAESLESQVNMKDISWGIAKIMPPHIPYTHRFKIVDTDALTIDKVKHQIKTLKFVDNHESKYILIATGTKINHAEFNALVVDKPEYKIHRRILTKPNVWRSYKYLYPAVKKSMPFFNRAYVNSRDVTTAEYSIPNGIPHDLKAMIFHTNRNDFELLPTDNIDQLSKDSAKTLSWDEHGYKTPLISTN